VADTSLQIALDLPNGHTVTSQSASAEGLEWRSTNDPRTERTQVAGLLFPQAGRHHLIYFKRVARGAYTIRVLDGTSDFRALFLPYEEGWERYEKELNSRRPEPGKVSMRVFGSLQNCAFQKCFVGDALDIGIALEGDVAPATQRIEAFYDSPLRAANLVFLPKPDGSYNAMLTATQPGPLHLTVRAAGQTTAGVAFREERQIPEIIIATRPAPARVEQIVRPSPPVPKEAQAGCRVSLVSTTANRVGRIVASARIDEEGRAHEVKVIRSNNPALDRDAIEYVATMWPVPAR
jgi:hypothetical protein